MTCIVSDSGKLMRLSGLNGGKSLLLRTKNQSRSQRLHRLSKEQHVFGEERWLALRKSVQAFFFTFYV